MDAYVQECRVTRTLSVHVNARLASLRMQWQPDNILVVCMGGLASCMQDIEGGMVWGGTEVRSGRVLCCAVWGDGVV